MPPVRLLVSHCRPSGFTTTLHLPAPRGLRPPLPSQRCRVQSGAARGELGQLGEATSVCGCDHEELVGHREGWDCPERPAWAHIPGSSLRVSILLEAPSQDGGSVAETSQGEEDGYLTLFQQKPLC